MLAYYSPSYRSLHGKSLNLVAEGADLGVEIGRLVRCQGDGDDGARDAASATNLDLARQENVTKIALSANAARGPLGRTYGTFFSSARRGRWRTMLRGWVSAARIISSLVPRETLDFVSCVRNRKFAAYRRTTWWPRSLAHCQHCPRCSGNLVRYSPPFFSCL